MAFRVADRVKERTSSTGTGSLTLSDNNVDGFQPFSSGISSGDTTFYVIDEAVLNGPDAWEVGIGTYTAGSFSRDTILSSSNGGSKIDLNGSGVISITYPADRSVYINDDHCAVVGSGVLFDDASDCLHAASGNLYFGLTQLAVADAAIGGSGAVDGVAIFSGSTTLTSDDLTYDRSSKELNVAGTGTFDYVRFDTSIDDTAQTTGSISWNNTAGTIDIGLDGDIVHHIGQETYYRVQNHTGSTIYKGQTVYASGATAGGSRMLVAPFVADGSITEPRFLGVATTNMTNGSLGFVNHFGFVKNVDTRTSNTAINPNAETWNLGDILFAHPTIAGGLTKVKPKESIYTAMVLGTGNNGELFVRPTDHGHLSDLHDVTSDSPNNNDVLIYNSGSDLWEPSPAIGADVSYVSGIAVQNEIDINYVSGVAQQAYEIAIAVSGIGHYDYQNVTADVIASRDDDIIFVNSSISAVNVYMPLASGIGGKQMKIKWTDGDNVINIFPSGSETIDGQSSMTMTHKYQSTTLSSNNANWFIT